MNGFHLEVFIECQHEEYCFLALSPSYQIKNVGSVPTSFITNFVEEKECLGIILVWVWPYICRSLCDIWYKISFPVLMASIPNEIRPDHSGDNTALNTRDLYLFWSNPAPPSWLIQTERVTPQLQLEKHSKVGNGFSWHIPGFHPSHVMVICLSSMCSVLKAGGLCLSHSHLIKILLSRTHPDPTPRSGLTHQTSWVILSELNQHQHSTCTDTLAVSLQRVIMTKSLHMGLYTS